jgi:hypothetical protein
MLLQNLVIDRTERLSARVTCVKDPTPADGRDESRYGFLVVLLATLS